MDSARRLGSRKSACGNEDEHDIGHDQNADDDEQGALQVGSRPQSRPSRRRLDASPDVLVVALSPAAAATALGVREPLAFDPTHPRVPSLTQTRWPWRSYSMTSCGRDRSMALEHEDAALMGDLLSSPCSRRSERGNQHGRHVSPPSRLRVSLVVVKGNLRPRPTSPRRRASPRASLILPEHAVGGRTMSPGSSGHAAARASPGGRRQNGRLSLRSLAAGVMPIRRTGATGDRRSSYTWPRAGD